MSDDELTKVIMDLVISAWRQKQPVLLSELGAYDRGEVARKSKEISGGLSMYLDQNLNDDCIIIKHSKKHTVIGVVPRNLETEGITDFDSVLEQRLSARSDQKVRFSPSFWAAFRKKPEPDSRRFVGVEGDNRFRILSSEADSPEGMVEIGPEYIAADDEIPDADVYTNIGNWARANNFSLEKFSVGASRQSTRDGFSRLPKDATTLDRLLCALDSSDLKRIEMPLDIIKKLSKSKL